MEHFWKQETEFLFLKNTLYQWISKLVECKLNLKNEMIPRIFTRFCRKIICYHQISHVFYNQIVSDCLIELKDQQKLSYRFSAFWLRSKCSICSYQLNIWYEDHVSSSILNLFLQGDGMSGACSGSIKSWLCIAVPQRSAHFPTSNHA